MEAAMSGYRTKRWGGLRFKGFLYLFLSLFLVGVAWSWPGWNVIIHEGRRHVPVEDVARFYGMRLQWLSTNEFQLVGNGRKLRGRANTKEVLLDGVKYVLCFPLVAREGTVLVSAMDVTKIIEPVLRPSKIQNATLVRTVILDAGHGGHDSGAVGPYGREKDFALDVAKRAKALLEQRGFRVLLTRSDDRFIPLEERSAFANRQRDAIFISIHFNKSVTGQASGIETFALAPRGVPSMGEEDVTVNAVARYPGHARDPENILLATAVHSSLLRFCPLPDRGIKRARFHVIRETTIPAVLIEGGFMNHPLDARYIAHASYRQRLAMGITEGVLRFQRAVKGRPFLPTPHVVASGSDPTSAPVLQTAVRRTDAPPVPGEENVQEPESIKEYQNQGDEFNKEIENIKDNKTQQEEISSMEKILVQGEGLPKVQPSILRPMGIGEAIFYKRLQQILEQREETGGIHADWLREQVEVEIGDTEVSSENKEALDVQNSTSDGGGGKDAGAEVEEERPRTPPLL